MTLTTEAAVPLRHADRFFIDGAWVVPSSEATFEVIDSATEQVYFQVPEAQAPDIDRAVASARRAFDEGPWPALSHGERARFLEGMASGLRARAEDIGQIWPRESGVLYSMASRGAAGIAGAFDYYAGLADTFPFEEPAQPTQGRFGLLVREPVGVVGAIIPWNAPIGLITYKIAPALLAGCAGRRLRRGGGGRGHRLAGRGAQRGDRRPRGLRAPGAGPARGQDHLHRLHCRRAADRLDLR